MTYIGHFLTMESLNKAIARCERKYGVGQMRSWQADRIVGGFDLWFEI